MIRPITPTDLHDVVTIYNHYIENTTVSFEEDPISPESMQERVNKVLNADLPWLVFEENGKVIGYAYAGLWNTRSAYRFTVETSVYLSPESVGKGLGKQLYSHLLKILKEKGLRNVLGVIAQPNPASVGFHESFGFRKMGEFSEVGLKFGRCISVGYWQLKMGDDL